MESEKGNMRKSLEINKSSISCFFQKVNIIQLQSNKNVLKGLCNLTSEHCEHTYQIFFGYDPESLSEEPATHTDTTTTTN